MSKVVDSVELTDGGGKVEKKITINLGDGVAREQSAQALQKAEEALVFAGIGVTNDYSVNRIIRACSCYYYDGALAEIDGWFYLHIGRGDNGVTDLEIESEYGELHTLVDGYNEFFWDNFGRYMRIYVSYRNAEFAGTDSLGFTFTNVVARPTSYALLEALQKGGNILKIEGAPVDFSLLNSVFLACYTESSECYGMPVDISDKRWSVHDNDYDDNGYPVNILLIDNDTGDQYVIVDGANSFESNDGLCTCYLYADIAFMQENDVSVDGIHFSFTTTTMESSQYALWRALERLRSTENQVSSALNKANEAKEEASSALDKANGEMIAQDPTGEYIPQMLVLNADGSVYKGDLQDLSVSGGNFNGLSNRIETKYFKLKSPEGLQIIGYLPHGTGPGVSGKYEFTPNAVSVRQNIPLLLYEDLLKKQEVMNQERDAQNLVMGNYMIHGKTPMMMWRNEGDTRYTVEYEKKWADTPNMFKTDDGKLQDILMLDCEGVSTFYKAFELTKGGYEFLYRKLRSVKGICNYGNVASFERMFYKSGGNIEEIQFIPEKVTKKVKVASMFGELRKLTSVNIEDVEFTSVEESANFMFVFCGVKKLIMPALPGVVTIFGMFQECYRLEYLDMSKFDFSNVTDPLDLSASYRLEHLTGIKNIKMSCKIGNSPLLTYDSIMDIINGLYDLTEDDDYTPQSLTLHSNAYAKLSDEDIEIATNKGWNIIEA